MGFFEYYRRLKKRFLQRSFRDNLSRERSKTLLWNEHATPGFIAPRAQQQSFRFRGIFTFFHEKASRIQGIALIVGSVLIILSLYIVAFSVYFQIAPTEVIIERTDPLSDLTLGYRGVEDFYGRSIFLTDTTAVRRSLKKYQQNLSDITVKKVYPRGLNILISSYPPVFLTTIGSDRRPYVITRNGIAISQGGSSDVILPIDIFDPSLADDIFFEYREMIRLSAMNKILEIGTLYDKVFSAQSKVVRLQYFAAEQEIHFLLESNTRLIFDLSEKSEDMLVSLKFLITSGLKPGEWTTLSYIDLRNPLKLFVCRDADVCRQNMIRIYGKSIFDR